MTLSTSRKEGSDSEDMLPTSCPSSEDVSPMSWSKYPDSRGGVGQYGDLGREERRGRGPGSDTRTDK